MKKLLVLLLVGCTTTSDVEKQLGEGASCRTGHDNTFLCTKLGKSYICYPEAYSDNVLCFEAVSPADIK